MMTEAEIYDQLGLIDPDRYALSQIRRNVSPPMVERHDARWVVDHALDGTGRTTRMAIQILAAISAGKRVVIVGTSRIGADYLAERVYELGLPIGIELPDRIPVWVRRPAGVDLPPVASPPDTIFETHP